MPSMRERVARLGDRHLQHLEVALEPVELAVPRLQRAGAGGQLSGVAGVVDALVAGDAAAQLRRQPFFGLVRQHRDLAVGQVGEAPQAVAHVLAEVGSDQGGVDQGYLGAGG
jgi:hypothetical protein